MRLDVASDSFISADRAGPLHYLLDQRNLKRVARSGEIVLLDTVDSVHTLRGMRFGPDSFACRSRLSGQ